MTAYTLRFGPDGDTCTRPLAIEGHTAADLAQAVHRHARGRLGSQRVDIHIDPDTLTGTVLAHGVPVGEFTLTVVDEQAPVTVDTSAHDHVAHGYTLRDIGRLTRAACAADRSMSADITTRYDIAWSAIAEHLCAAETPPDWNELTRVGWQAIYREVREMRVMFGFKDRDGTTGVATAPRYVQYWTVLPATPEEGLIERIAVAQVLGTLTGTYRDAIVALAVHGNYQAAADALGIQYKALVARIGTARKQIRTLWFAPETAPPIKGTDRRVGSYGKQLATHCREGHEWTPENTYWRAGRNGRRNVRTCRACEQIRSKARVAARQQAATKAVAA